MELTAEALLRLIYGRVDESALPVLAGGLLAFVIVDLLARGSGYPLLASESRQMIGSLFAGCLAALLLSRWDSAVTLTPQGVMSRRTGKRLINWSDIADISVTRVFGTRAVMVTMVGGKRVRLRAPQGFLDRHFDEKVQVIRACWLGRPESYRA